MEGASFKNTEFPCSNYCRFTDDSVKHKVLFINFTVTILEQIILVILV